MNPLALYPAIALAGLLLVGGFYKYGYSNGWDSRDFEMQIEIAKKNEEARQTEQKLAEVVQAKETELRKANDVVNKKQTDLNRLIAAGRVRLPAASCPQTSASAPAAARDSNQARTEPDQAADADPGPSESERQTLQLIAQIAAEGDRAINQLNACIDAYENMRTIINAQR
jgi:hypothetical protein